MAGTADGGKLDEGKLKPLESLATPPTMQGGDGKGKGILMQEQACSDRWMTLVGDAGEEGAHEVVGVDAERLEVLVLPHQNLLKNNKKRITSLTLVICLMIY